MQYLKQRARNSRWSRDPVVSRDGAAVAVYPTERDIEIFKLLVRFRYLPADYIHAFVGGSAKALTHRLNLLSRTPNLYLSRPHQQRQNAEANHRPLIYQLDERGSRALRERGLPFPPKSYHHNFAHELMVAQITASIELGIRHNPSITLITWPEILANPNTPPITTAPPQRLRRCASPIRSAVRPGPTRSTPMLGPFGLKRLIDGKPSYLFFPGIEADCGTEPVDAVDTERSSIVKKFAAYMAIAEQGIHRSHFGFPNFFVPFITGTGARLRTMMELLDRLTDGRGSKIFLFKTFPTFASLEKPPAPSGHMLTEPWQRVGFPPLSLDR